MLGGGLEPVTASIWQVEITFLTNITLLKGNTWHCLTCLYGVLSLVLLLVLLGGPWESGSGDECGLDEENTLSWSSSKSCSCSERRILLFLPPSVLQDFASSSSDSFCRRSASTCLILRFSSRTRSISTKSSCICSSLKTNSIHAYVCDRSRWQDEESLVRSERACHFFVWSGFSHERLHSHALSLKAAPAPGTQLVMFPRFSCSCTYGFRLEKYTNETLPCGKNIRILSLFFWNSSTTMKDRLLLTGIIMALLLYVQETSQGKGWSTM